MLWWLQSWGALEQQHRQNPNKTALSSSLQCRTKGKGCFWLQAAANISSCLRPSCQGDSGGVTGTFRLIPVITSSVASGLWFWSPWSALLGASKARYACNVRRWLLSCIQAPTRCNIIMIRLRTCCCAHLQCPLRLLTKHQHIGVDSALSMNYAQPHNRNRTMSEQFLP